MEQGSLGRTALVTGAGSGIGRAIALALAREGARVALVGRTAEKLEATSRTILAGEGECFAVPCDITDDRQIDRAGSMIEAALGPVEILINNAGAAHSAPIGKTDDATIDALMRLNVRSVFALCRRFVPGMKEAGYGRIVNIASTAAHRGVRYTALYTATKHALGGLTRSLAAELVPAGITVNAVCPGFVDTAIVTNAARTIAEKSSRSEEEARGQLAAMNPLGRLVTPEEVAAAIMTLLTPLSGALNGHSLILDGGTQPV